jgi:hypothetical protein
MELDNPKKNICEYKINIKKNSVVIVSTNSWLNFQQKGCHELFPNETIPNVKIPKLRKNPETSSAGGALPKV